MDSKAVAVVSGVLDQAVVVSTVLDQVEVVNTVLDQVEVVNTVPDPAVLDQAEVDSLVKVSTALDLEVVSMVLDLEVDSTVPDLVVVVSKAQVQVEAVNTDPDQAAVNMVLALVVGMARVLVEVASLVLDTVVRASKVGTVPDDRATAVKLCM